MKLKPLARFCYAHIPALAAARFAAMDLTASYFMKPEYQGTLLLSIGDGLIIDVGANRGQSIGAFRKLAPRSNIVAFEPDPRSAERLIERYQADDSVSVQSYALGAESGMITFFVPTYGRWDCDGMAATNRAEATEWLRNPGRMYRFDETKLTLHEYPIECRTLDSYDMSPRLIKLHAQGAELAILEGASRTIRQHVPALMCAFPTTEITELLAGWGYQPHTYSKGRFTPGIAARPVTFTWYLMEDQAKQLSAGSPFPESAQQVT
jgi:FkbM family methyltransferase